MKKSTLGLLCVMPALLLAGCFGSTTSDTSGTSSSTSAASSAEMSSAAIPETKNVTYEGTITPAGISMYQQGTHRLNLAGDKFILLESSALDLNLYVDKHVMVSGDVRPTIEAGAQIMRVQTVKVLEDSATSSMATSSSSTPVSSSSLSASSASAIASSSRSSVSSIARSSAASLSAVASSALSSASSSVSAMANMGVDVQAMAKDTMAASFWTQEYCSSHIGFCIPVHKNWWYKSFGTTTSFLWHVELRNSEILNLGEGPIVVNLAAGDLSTVGGSDGDVRVVNGNTVGYRAWTDNEHFEILAPTALDAAVRYITQNLSRYQAQ